MKAPGKCHRTGLSLPQLFQLFPDEKSARHWFEQTRWPNQERYCPHCGSMDRPQTVPNEKPMPYRCGDCRKYFSVRTGTVMERSRISYRNWAIGLYLATTSLKGVSSMKLHRDLGVTQKTAWFMLHRIRLAWQQSGVQFLGPVEVDETYIGGKESRKHASKKARLGRGVAGKTPVAGAKDRATNRISATVLSHADRKTLSGFVAARTRPGATVITDGSTAYHGLAGVRHFAVQHSVGQYVRGMAHTNGIESFWSLLKRGFYGTYHKISVKHLQRYVNEFAGRHNIRDLDTIKQMAALAHGMGGKRLTYKQLTG